MCLVSTLRNSLKRHARSGLLEAQTPCRSSEANVNCEAVAQRKMAEWAAARRAERIQGLGLRRVSSYRYPVCDTPRLEFSRGVVPVRRIHSPLPLTPYRLAPPTGPAE